MMDRSSHNIITKRHQVRLKTAWAKTQVISDYYSKIKRKNVELNIAYSVEENTIPSKLFVSLT